MNGDYNAGQLGSDHRIQSVDDQPEIRQGEGANSPDPENQAKFGVRTCSAHQPEPGTLPNGSANPCCSPADSCSTHRLSASQRTDEVPEVCSLPAQNPLALAANPDIHFSALEIFNRFHDKQYDGHRIGSRYSLDDVNRAMNSIIFRPEATLDYVTGKVLVQCMLLAKKTGKAGIAKAGSAPGNPGYPHPADGTKPASQTLPANASQTPKARQQITPVDRSEPVNGSSSSATSIQPPVTQLADLPSDLIQQVGPEDENNTLFIKAGLMSLWIAEDKVEKIMQLRPYSLQKEVLRGVLKNNVKLTNDELADVLQYLESCGEFKHEPEGSPVDQSRPEPVNGSSSSATSIQPPDTQLADLPSDLIQQVGPEDENNTLFIKAGLMSLWIAEDKVEKIMQLRPYSLQKEVLRGVLKNNVKLTNDELADVLQYLESCGEFKHEPEGSPVDQSRPEPVNGSSSSATSIQPPDTQLADLPSYLIQQVRPEDGNDALFIKSGLKSLGLAQDKVDRIMQLKPHSMETQTLCTVLKYAVKLTDNEQAAVLQFLESCGESNHELDVRGSVAQRPPNEKTLHIELDAAAKKKKTEATKEQQVRLVAEYLRRCGYLHDPYDKVIAVLMQLPTHISTLQGAAQGDEHCLFQILSDYAEFKPSGRVPSHSECYNSSESGILISDPDYSSQNVNVVQSSRSDTAEERQRLSASPPAPVASNRSPIPNVVYPGQNPWIMAPDLSAVSGVKPQAPAVITRTHGGVTLRVRAGIQARNNNCSLAAFFVSLSHNGLLRKLIEDAEIRVEMLRSSGQSEQPLTELIATLKTFDIGDDREKFIPNDDLDQIRFRYGLRAVRFIPDAMSELTQGQIGDFLVGSAFKGGGLLCSSNQQAVISLKKITGIPSLVEVISLPDHALGYMRVNGMNLTVGQKLTHTDLCGLDFIPLGEVLEPVEFIPPILNEIYGRWSGEASSEESPTASLKRNMTLIEVQSNEKIRNVRTVPSENFSAKIEDEIIPEDYVLDEKRLYREPHPFHRNVLRSVTEYYCQNGVVMLKLTKELDFRDQSVERKIFQYFTAHGKLEKKIAVHFKQQGQNSSFISGKYSEFINAQGQAITVEHKLYGYCKDEPTSGSIKTTVMQRVESVEDFIQIYNDSLNDFSPDNACYPKEVPVTDKTCPDVLFVTVPNFGSQNRCDLKWLKGANIGQASYEVSAVVAIKGSHYVSWCNDSDNGQIHYADSMADISHDIGTVPVIVTMPNHNTDVALQTAHEVIGCDNGHIRNAKEKLEVLGKELALFILKRVS